MSKNHIAIPHQRVFLAMLLLSSAFSCSRKTSSALEPLPLTSPPAMQSSQLNVRIHISRTLLDGTINHLIHKQFGEGLQFEDGIRIDTRLDGPVSIQASGQELLLQLPLHLDIIPGGIFSSFKMNGGLSLQLKSKYAVLENQLHFKTELTHHQWTKKPVVQILGLSLPIEGLANFVIRRYRQSLCTSMDASVMENLRLHEMGQSLAKYFNQPLYRSFDDQLNVYANPLEFALGPLRMSPTSLEIPVTAFFETVLSDSLPEGFGSTIQFSVRPFAEENSELYLQSRIPLPLIERLLNEQISGQTYGSGMSRVGISSLKAGGVANRMYVLAETTGAFDGDLQLSFVPVYDFSNREIRLSDFQLRALQGKRINKILFGIFKGVAETRIRKTIEDQINATIRDYESNIHKLLDHTEVIPGIEVYGSLKQYSLSNILFYQDRLYCDLHSTLKMDAEVKAIDTSKLIIGSF
ncbi:MAG: DUF4403 family protein [Saprospiraceae bacterium]|jgi:hypothetical protein|nr:DUF4403 family protein [Saprospiraceae bacterium]